MDKKLRLAAFAIALAFACTPAAAAYTSIFAFGDSLSDAGNLFSESEHTIPLKPYVDGHFSNGPTWVEDLSQMLGLGPMRSAHSILWIPTRSKARCIRWTLAPMTS